MHPKDFDKLDDELWNTANMILRQRSKAYGTKVDFLDNFKASMRGSPPHVVWEVLFQKGLKTVFKLMAGEEVPGEHVIDRFADAINYLRLGYALYIEREGKCSA